MKKIIRLTEYDLVRVIKRIINEQPDPDFSANEFDKKKEQKPSEELFSQAIQDIKTIIPQLSHDIIHRNNLDHNEENMVKVNKELLKKVYAGDDDILDKLWDLAGNSLLRNAVNIITAYTANKLI